MLNDNSRRLAAGWILIAFAVWCFAFRGFLASKFAFTSDALSYYDHIRFFIENLRHGVYALWDPFWFSGAPNDFFLRRIGAFNPCYLLILLFQSIGLSYHLAYLWFLAVYYWSGMVAFYLLAMRLYNNRLIAYGGYLILLFSALGTRLFDSYMMLVTVPLLWFFYFLTAMTQTPRRHFFLGLALSFMILAGTYIPFYFLIILVFFLVFFCLLYPDRLPGIFKQYALFFKANKRLAVSALLVVVLSFLPLLLFFHHTTQGQVVLPVRHGGAVTEQTLTVAHRTLDWGIGEDLLYSAYFSNLKMFKAAVVYVPFFSIIVLALGLIGRINRRTVFIFLLGLGLLCCFIPHGFPFYDFLYRHLFVLKFFRNLHFFIWFFLLPLFVLLVLEHWNMFMDIEKTTSRKWLLALYVLTVHAAALYFVWWRGDAVNSTYVMIFLSLSFWLLTLMGQSLIKQCWRDSPFLKSNIWGFALLTLIVVVQPLEAYYYFSLKAEPLMSSYDYDFPYRSLQIKATELGTPERFSPAKQSLYYISGSYNFLYQHLSNAALVAYLQNKFLLTDRLVGLERPQALGLMEENFVANGNAAITFSNGRNFQEQGDDPNPGQQARAIIPGEPRFQLLGFDANHLSVSLDLPYKKFLVYNDSYDPDWKVSVNHHPATLYEVNGAFKGVWVPAGSSIVEFSYGAWWQYAMNVLLSVFAFIFFVGVICGSFFSI